MTATLVACRCNLCSAEIEFESSRAGETITCPLCGMETTLYLSQNQSASAPPPLTSQQITHDGETVFLNEGSITVTNARFIVGSQTYAMRNITSVRGAEVPPRRLGANILGVIGVCFLFYAFFFGFTQHILAGLFGATSLVICVFTNLVLLRSDFQILVNTAGGEQSAYESWDSARIARIIDALNKAIVFRG